MSKKSIVRLDKVKSVYGGHLYSVIDENNDLENGFVAKLDGLKDGERELYNIDHPGTDDPLVLIANPEVNYEECRATDKALGNFYIPEGTPARAYEMHRTDIISISEEGIEGEVEKGKYVIGQDNSYKLEIADSVDDETFVGKIKDVETIGTSTVTGMAGHVSNVTKFAVIEVVKNG